MGMDTKFAIVQMTRVFEDKSIWTFLQCQSLRRSISRSSKVHVTCPCFSVDNFRQFWSFCILAYHMISVTCRSSRCYVDTFKPVMRPVSLSCRHVVNGLQQSRLSCLSRHVLEWPPPAAPSALALIMAISAEERIDSTGVNIRQNGVETS